MSRFIRGWKMFQHYKHRRPRWIKLYRELLDDRDWHNLDGAAAKALINLFLVAAENGGQLPDDDRDLAFRLRMTEKQFAIVLPQLSPWLSEDASNLLTGFENTLAGSSPETETETEAEAEAEAEAEGEIEVEVIASSHRSEAKKKASRLSEDWTPSEDQISFAKSEGFSASEIDREAATFRDYWISRPGAGGVKLNWNATWRNWIRKATESKRNGRYVQDDSKSAGAAAGRLAELAERGHFTFGPRPSLLPAQSPNVVRLLPEGRSERSGDVQRGDSGDLPRLSANGSGSGG